MSAFVVNKRHIDAIIQAGLLYHRLGSNRWYHNGAAHELTLDNANEVGQMLLNENVRSVEARYPQDMVTELPGRCDAEWIIPYQYKSVTDQLPGPVGIIKLIHCLIYQSCEHSEWEKSEAYTFLARLERAMTAALPGYDKADWEFRYRTMAEMRADYQSTH